MRQTDGEIIFIRNKISTFVENIFLSYSMATTYAFNNNNSKNQINLLNFVGVFFYFNSALNPILYSVMSKRFRRGFADIRTRFLNKLLHLPGAAAAQQSERSGSGKLYPPQGMMPR